jgi:hypothetical protein
MTIYYGLNDNNTFFHKETSMKHMKRLMKLGTLATLMAALCLSGTGCEQDSSDSAGYYYKPGLYLGGIPVEGFTGEPSLANIIGWLEINAEDGKEYTIRLDKPETLERRNLSYGNKNVTIILTGTSSSRQVASSGPVFSLSPDKTGVLFHVGNNEGIGKVTLILSGNVTLKGHENNTSNVIYVNRNGSLVMEGNAKITGNTNKGSGSGAHGGGGVSVRGSFTMRDKAGISGNTVVNGHGGGVSIIDGGTFTMRGGSISNNTARGEPLTPGALTGGGIVVVSSTGNPGSAFVMEGGKISNNTLIVTNSDGIGGGIFISDSSEFTMKGGEISGNKIETPGFAGGGGVYVGNASNFTMEGGAISANTSTSTGAGSNSQGGGVYIGNTCSFTMKSGTISRNALASSGDWAGGGGIALSPDTNFDKTGGIVYGTNGGTEANTVKAQRSIGGTAIWAGGGTSRNTTVTENLNKAGSNYTGKWND